MRYDVVYYGINVDYISNVQQSSELFVYNMSSCI